MINLGDKKLPVGLAKPGLLGPLDLHDDAVLHDRQDGPVAESPQGVSDPGQSGIVRRCSGLGRGGGIGAMPLTVGWFVAHVMLVALLGMGKRKDGRGSDHVFRVGEKHANLAGCDRHAFSRLECQIAGGVGRQVDVKFALRAIGPA